jgi:hypothetical protein
VRPVRSLRSPSLPGHLLIIFPRRPTILDSRRVAKEDSRVALDNREAREAGSWRLRRTHMEENATRTLEVWFPSLVGSTLCQFRDQWSAHIGEMRRKYGALLDSLC